MKYLLFLYGRHPFSIFCNYYFDIVKNRLCFLFCHYPSGPRTLTLTLTISFFFLFQQIYVDFYCHLLDSVTCNHNIIEYWNTSTFVDRIYECFDSNICNHYNLVYSQYLHYFWSHCTGNQDSFLILFIHRLLLIFFRHILSPPNKLIIYCTPFSS